MLLDALGTLVRLEPPAPRLRARLRERAGVDVGDAAAAEAMRAEIAFYRANLHRGRDAAGLARLRDGCAAVVAAALGPAAPLHEVRTALLEAIEFAPYEDAVPALERLRAAGARLAVVSNWDVSLHEVLARTGLRPLVDAAVSSAEAGAAKPDPRPFALALEHLGVAAADAWHVGDTPAEDVAGARAAGVLPVLVDRNGSVAAPTCVRVVSSLAALP
ncbi:MAG TPA: HAD family hydrolase [Solirubrobacteraceae bacterium]|nr:HAD family hydrolase [Solirubrobacteraceae bacterium]